MGVRIGLYTVLVLFFSLFAGKTTRAQVFDSCSIASLPDTKDSIVVAAESTSEPDGQPVVKPKRRLVAALLCLALGPFGMHRLYLGTKPRVAAAYTLTLGGGVGLVPLIDLFYIVFDPNLYKYKDNDKFLMWTK